VFGVGLRFVKVPDEWVPYLAPAIVGVAVTAGVILLLRLIVVAGEASEKEAAQRRTPKPNNPPPVKPPSGQMRKAPLARAEVKRDTQARLAALARLRRNGRN